MLGPKMRVDPEKCFQELTSDELLMFFAGWALFGIDYRFQQFSGFALLAGQITGISLKAINSSKAIIGPALSRINSVFGFGADSTDLLRIPLIFSRWSTGSV